MSRTAFEERFDVSPNPGDHGFDPRRLPRITEHFDREVAAGRLPGWSALVARHGTVVYAAGGGRRDLASGRPVEPDTRWRLFSMTKPVTSVAAMTLVERGLLGLDDPVERFVPEFAAARVYTGGPAGGMRHRPATEPVRIWHLLTHTAGLTLGFAFRDPVDARYREIGQTLLPRRGATLGQTCADLAQVPLLFDPGTAWNYSASVDVLGRVLEVVTGRPFDDLVTEEILAPLAMTGTGFHLAPELRPQLAEIYRVDPASGALTVDEELREAIRVPAPFPSGGGGPGLVSTLGDYHRFATMLAGRGQLGAVRLLGPRTVDLMTRNHLPGGADLAHAALYPDPAHRGQGFGLGFATMLDPVAAHSTGSTGEYGWSGAANTHFFVDPATAVTAVFCTQVVGALEVRDQLRTLVYQAFMD